VFGTLGQAYTATSRPDLAVELFERCLGEIAEDAPEDVAVRVRFTTYLGNALSELDELERAQSVLDAALKRADEVTDPYALARAAERVPWAASHRARVRPARARTARRHG
jgi:tetratricopeptide (TPR) repeat protein